MFERLFLAYKHFKQKRKRKKLEKEQKYKEWLLEYWNLHMETLLGPRGQSDTPPCICSDT